jgi:hypothetical protein
LQVAAEDSEEKPKLKTVKVIRIKTLCNFFIIGECNYKYYRRDFAEMVALYLNINIGIQVKYV